MLVATTQQISEWMLMNNAAKLISNESINIKEQIANEREMRREQKQQTKLELNASFERSIFDSVLLCFSFCQSIGLVIIIKIQ